MGCYWNFRLDSLEMDEEKKKNTEYWMLGFYHERELLIDPHLYFGILGHVDSLSYVITLYFNCVVMNS